MAPLSQLGDRHVPGGEAGMIALSYVSVVLVAVGVVFIWGIDGSVRNLDANTIGGIVVLAGLIGALVSTVVWAKREGSSLPVEDDAPFSRR
jgi:hypothetical protein